MTFSLILRDPDTGEIGAAISSSSPAVSARCINLADEVGGAISQNVTDPRLGPQLLDQLRMGATPQQAIDNVVRTVDGETIQYRQLLVLDREGRAATFSGKRALGNYGATIRENGVAAGNMLKSIDVLDALVDTALDSPGRIEERLMAGLKAALARGGEEGPLHSAGLSVVGNSGWRVTDLRVDWAEENPIDALERTLDVWLPQRDDYTSRGINPMAAPSYGVPGDE